MQEKKKQVLTFEVASRHLMIIFQLRYRDVRSLKKKDKNN